MLYTLVRQEVLCGYNCCSSNLWTLKHCLKMCLLLQYSQDKGYCEDLTEGKFSFPIIHAITSHPEDSQVICILLFQSISFSDTSKTVYCSSYDIPKNFTMLPKCIKLWPSIHLCRITKPLLLRMVDSKSLVLHFDIIVKSLLASIWRFITLVISTYLIYPYHLLVF